MVDENGRGFDVLTAQALANGAAERYKNHYSHAGKWQPYSRFDAAETHARLVALGASPTPEQVAEVIGNDTWTNITCLVCGASVTRAMVFDDSEGFLAKVCESCLAAGLEAVRNA